MTTIFTQRGAKLLRTAINEPDSWISIVAPDETELATLTRDYGIDPEELADILDLNERSRVEIRDEGSLTIVRVPFDDGVSEVRFQTAPVGIFLTPQTIITVSAVDVPVIQSITENKVRGFTLKDRSLFVPKFLHATALGYLRYLKEINAKSSQIEEDLRGSVHNTELIALLHLEKSLVHFTTSLRSNGLLFDRLQRLSPQMEVDMDELEEAQTEHRQAIETANIHSNILSGMMDAFASVISNNVNTVMRRLTGISIVLMIPTLVASLYGMNVPLPFQGSAWALPGILGVSGVLAAIVAVFLVDRRRRPRRRAAA